MGFAIIIAGLLGHLWMAYKSGEDDEDRFIMFVIYLLPFCMHYFCIGSIEKIGYVLFSTMAAVVFSLYLILNYYLHGGDAGFLPLLIGLPINFLVAAINMLRVSVYKIAY